MPRGSSASRGTTSAGRGHGISDQEGTSICPSLPRQKANIHPGQIIKDQKQKRRTSQQVQEDKAKAAAAAAATREAQQEAENDKIRRVASAEDRLRKEDLEYKQRALRPDLHLENERIGGESLVKGQEMEIILTIIQFYQVCHSQISTKVQVPKKIRKVMLTYLMILYSILSQVMGPGS